MWSGQCNAGNIFQYRCKFLTLLAWSENRTPLIAFNKRPSFVFPPPPLGKFCYCDVGSAVFGEWCDVTYTSVFMRWRHNLKDSCVIGNRRRPVNDFPTKIAIEMFYTVVIEHSAVRLGFLEFRFTYTWNICTWSQNSNLQSWRPINRYK